MCRENSPTLPWAGLASRAQQSTIMADRNLADRDPDCSGLDPDRVEWKNRLATSSEVFATSLRPDRPGSPPCLIARSVGIAFTAVSPFY